MSIPSTIESNTGEKTFTTLVNAAWLLKELGVPISCGERELIEEELNGVWKINVKRKGDTSLTASDFKDLMKG